MRYKSVITIAGSDSGGGAGIQADLKTISALGCYGTTAITAITAQNTLGVTAIHPVPRDIIKRQLEAVLEDIGTDAVKIGMLHSVDIIKTVRQVLKQYELKNVVLDPVMVAASGDKLIEDNTVDALAAFLFPLADTITPNIPEAEILLNRKITGRDDMIRAAGDLLQFGSRSVLLKGGHLAGDMLYDVFINRERPDDIRVYENKKVITGNVHGTGCTLSSAIASCLALGEELEKAVQHAIKYLQQAIVHGKIYQTGKGSGPVNHFYNPEKLK